MTSKAEKVLRLEADQTCSFCSEPLSAEVGNGLLCLRIVRGAVEDFVSTCSGCSSGFVGGPKRPLTTAGLLDIEGDYALSPAIRTRLEGLGLPGTAVEVTPLPQKRGRGRPRKDAAPSPAPPLPPSQKRRGRGRPRLSYPIQLALPAALYQELETAAERRKLTLTKLILLRLRTG